MRIEWLRRCAIGTCLVGAIACQTTSATGPKLAAEQEPANLSTSQAEVAAAPRNGSGLEPVYFEYDRWELREDSQRTLKANAHVGNCGTYAITRASWRWE